jgi:hypothetical protein
VQPSPVAEAETRKTSPAPPANRAPLAVADVASATEGGAVVTGSVAANDSDPDGNSLSFALAAPVAGRGSASSTLTITVAGANDAPVAVADSFTTNEDTALVIAAPGVLANDSDVDGDALTSVLVTGPAHGTLTLNANGSFTYTPDANYNGADSFTYKANDGTADGNTGDGQPDGHGGQRRAGGGRRQLHDQ